MARKGIAYFPQGAKRVHAAENRVELEDGTQVPYDYLVIATGPELAFDEIEGLGPDGYTQSICHVDHADEGQGRPSRSSSRRRGRSWSARCRAPPASGRPTSSPSSSTPSCAARKIRDKVPMTFVTSRALYRPSRPRRRRRHQGPARKRDARAPHQVDHQRQGEEDRRRQDDGRGGGRRRRGQEDARGAVRLFDDAAGLPRRRGGARHRGAGQSARLRHRRQAPAQSEVPERLQRRRLRRDPAGRQARRCRSACRRPAS